jgi:hypothetical protein
VSGGPKDERRDGGVNPADPWGAFGASWTASADAWSAWSETWRSILEKRGGPIAALMTNAFANPTAWPESVAPLLEEIRDALALPQFADLPRMDGSTLPSAGPAVDLMLVSQQYLSSMMPVWVKACDSFQAEVLARRAKGEVLDSAGEGMDIWNNVLDRTLMEFNRSGDFAKVQQRLLQASMRQKQEMRRAVEMAAEAIDMPTRTELTDVYRRLHDLLREVHGLRREVRALRENANKPDIASPA